MNYLKLFLLLFGINSLAVNHVLAKHLPAVIININQKETVSYSYYKDIFLKYKVFSIKPNGTAIIPFETNGFVPLTVYIETSKYIGLSMCLMPGDTVKVDYDAQNVTYNFNGRHLAELQLYKEYGESKFSERSMVSPVAYSNKRPFESFVRDWHTLWVESEKRIAKVTSVNSIRPEVRAHFILEARLRLLQILVEPIDMQSESDEMRPLPGFYQDTVFKYEKKLVLNSDNRSSPLTVFSHIGYTLFVAEQSNRKATSVAKYQIAKLVYTGYQREWVCYSVLERIFVTNKEIEHLPALLKDYKTWASPNSVFVKRLSEFNKFNNFSILKEEKFNETLLTTGGSQVNLFDIIRKNKGKVIYIDLWASWCRPCVKEMPASIEIQKQYDLQKLAFVYLSLDEDHEKWSKASTKYSIDNTKSYRLQNNNKSTLLDGLEINSIPHYLLIDKEGILRYSNAPNPSDPILRKLIDLII